MNTAQFESFMIEAKASGIINQDQLKDGLLMVGSNKNGRVIVRKTAKGIQRMTYRGNQLLEEDTKPSWLIYELCKADSHYVATTDMALATLAVKCGSFSFNFVDTDEAIDCELDSFRAPELSEMYINIACNDVARQIMGTFHCCIENIKNENKEIRYHIEDSGAQSSVERIDSLDNDSCYSYDIKALGEYMESKIPAGELNHRFGDLLNEMHQAYFLFAETYVESGKCYYYSGSFNRNNALQYDKEMFDQKLERIRVRALLIAQETTVESHLINHAFDEIGFHIGNYMGDI